MAKKMEELLDKIPVEKCWVLTAKILLTISVLRGVKTVIISPVSQVLNGSCGQCVRIGVLRTSYTGHWILPLMKITVVCAKIMDPKILPSYVILP